MRQWRIIKDGNNIIKAQWKDSKAPFPKNWNGISNYAIPYLHEDFETVEKAESEILILMAKEKVSNEFYKKSKQIKVLKSFKT